MKNSHISDLIRCGALVLILLLIIFFCIAYADGSSEETEKETTITTTTQTRTAPTSPPSAPEPTPEPTTIPRKEPYTLTDDERYIVEAVVAAEAIGEDFDGQCLVAQCIRNTAEATGMRPDEVVLEPNQYASPDYENAEQVSDAVAAVFDEGYQVTAEPIRYFYAPARCQSLWHERELTYVLTKGMHRFFKEKSE